MGNRRKKSESKVVLKRYNGKNSIEEIYLKIVKVFINSKENIFNKE